MASGRGMLLSLLALITAGVSLFFGVKTFPLLAEARWPMLPWFLFGLSLAAALAIPMAGQLEKLRKKDEAEQDEDSTSPR